jgi:hypothetical protein
MSVQAVVSLNTLHCIAESDRGGTSHSEPYVWPFLASVTTSPLSFSTTPRFPPIAESRKIIRNEMRAGDSANLEFPGNRPTITFDDQQSGHQLILIVALLEWDETPQAAIVAGHDAYLDALRDQLGRKILFFNGASEEEKRRLVDEIRVAVSAKVKSAIKGKLSLRSKLFDNQDDFLAVAYAHFPSLTAAPFTLRFAGKSGDPGILRPDAPIEFTLEGNLSVVPVVVDRCQAQVDALNAVEAKIRALQEQVRFLQSQLATATPQQKPAIISEIEQINAQRIPAARAALVPAQRSLGICRVLEQSQIPTVGGVKQVVG